MLMVLEIGLTVAAWKKGWKALALIPLGIVLCMGFFVGAAVGMSGGNVEAIQGYAWMIDALGIVALAVMAGVEPKKSY